MMRSLGIQVLVTALLLSVAGCKASTEAIEERLVLSPTSLIFDSGTESKSLSVTHTCTCPFSWTISSKGSPAWLIYQTSGSGDQLKVPITVVRAAAPRLPDSTLLYVRSNFGDDSVRVVVLP